MSPPEHPFGWPPRPPGKDHLDSLAANWRAKMLADYEAERTRFLSSVLRPLLEELGQEIGVLPRRLLPDPPEPPENTQSPKEASQCPGDGFQPPERHEESASRNHSASDTPSEACYDADNVVAQAVRASDPAGAIQRIGRGDRTCPEGRGDEAQAGEAGAEEAGLDSPRYIAFCLTQGPFDERAGIHKYRKGGLFSNNLRLVERYIEDLEHVGLRFSNAPSGDYYVFFQALPVPTLGAELDHTRCFRADTVCRPKDTCGQKCAVLVRNVKTMQGPEIANSIISRIWLQTPDKCFTGRSQNSYLSLRTGMIEHFSRLTDGERNVFQASVRIVPQSDGAREMIERGAQIMNSVAYDCYNWTWNNRGMILNLQDFVQSIGLCLFDDRVTVGSEGCLNPSSKLEDVLVGPF